MRLLLLLLYGLFFSSLLSAQDSYTGVVRDLDTGEPLPYVSVYHEASGSGVIADEDGRFRINLSAKALVKISYVGYQDQEVELQKRELNEVYLEKVIDYVTGPVIRDVPIQIRNPVPAMQLRASQLNRDLDISLLPALNRVPGLHMQTGNLNTNRISIRGIGSRSLYGTSKLRVYLNHIPLTDGSGNSSIEDIDMSIIDQADVLKGPGAVAYGAPLGGLIHLKAKQREAGSIFSKSTVGSFGLFRNSTGFNTQIGSNGWMKANYHLSRSDGYRDNSGFRREGLNLYGENYLGSNSIFQYLVVYSKLKAFIPSSLNENDFENQPTIAASNWQAVRGFEDYEKLHAGLSLEHSFGSLFNRNLVLVSSLFTSSYDGYELRPFNILDDNRQAMGGRTTLSLIERPYHSRKRTLLSLGTELFRDKVEWQTFETLNRSPGAILSNNRETRTYVNVFLKSDLQLGPFFISSGLNLNQTKYSYSDLYSADSLDLSGDYDFDPVVSPRLAISYTMEDRFSFFGNISHGFSAPSLEETLTPDGSINPDIQPEKGWSLEAGTRGLIFNSFHYEVSVYRMWVEDLLVARRISADQYVGVNAGKTRHDGLEVFLDYRKTWSDWVLRPHLTYTFTNYRFIEFEDLDQDYSGNRLTGVAPHQLFCGFDLQWQDKLYAFVNYEYRSAFPMRDDNSVNSDPYSLLHLKAGYKIDLNKGWQLDVFGGIQNLLNEHYASMILINAPSFGAPPRYYYPGLPRNWFAGLKISKSLN
ncbi:MAG: TonB-dependent receptor [Bacteroidetes bacterium]|nr:TonB-dependent receptor [Bacteroidota bacterium]